MATFQFFATNFGSNPGPGFESAWKRDPASPQYFVFNLNNFSWKALQPTPLPVALLSFMSYPRVLKPRPQRRG
jgi:hypothetical protein